MAALESSSVAGAETIAIDGLSFIASDEHLFSRFCGITGLTAGEMRAAASEPGFLAGVLDFILAHEPTLMAFSDESGHAPQAIGAAARQLPGATPHGWDHP
ncbi:hypothetical protein FP2506_04220 [Fulvimarina pelagi HTCC2506]|uniref:DUF3572 domain-containing protein n=2 Tax=Fulvimarina pelagi TaxID=217511 RepID=Q0FZ74_9HYPH|nr:DUF3572 domain-containing protein [Fulvimarina pelagi]EAU40404.1 hypothetical protein FP2506_04220 [Fulvimarina pelagi HTCC2506]BAT31438.1 hypothetical protein [Fulvimarina pelagi]